MKMNDLNKYLLAANFHQSDEVSCRPKKFDYLTNMPIF